MTKQQTLSVNKLKQLIDLNGDSTNFHINYKIESKNQKPFDILIVDQTTLDNTPNLEYKKVEKGVVSGEIKQENNIYQNYFLVIKADEPVECVLTIDKKDLPKTPQNQAPQMTTPPITKKETSWLKYVLIFLVLAVAGYMIYNMVVNKKAESDNYNSPLASPVASPVHMGNQFNFKTSAIDRLKKLNLN